MIMVSPSKLFDCLLTAYGPQQWWPAESVEEMMIGAILVQNTTWTQTSRVIAQLDAQHSLSMAAIRQMAEELLWQHLRPAGYFRVKTRRLKALANFMLLYHDQTETLFQLPTTELRHLLLQVHGIGKETADSIICYGAKQPIFVVDAYCRRLFQRLGWIAAKASYDEVQTLVHERFPMQAQPLGEFHALIVHHAKEHCQARPVCNHCPVPFCPSQGSLLL